MKSGIDYFPLDVNNDVKLDLIEAEFGITGFGVVVQLLREIYGKQGYYIEWTTEVALLFAKKIGLGGSAVSEIVSASIRRGMFDKDLYEKYQVLTSNGIQKRYFEAVKRRKEIEVDEHILLVNVAQICKNADIKRRNVNISSKNADIPKQSKVEKSKEKKSKGEYGARTRFAPPTLEEVTAYVKERKSIVDPQGFIDFYASKGWLVGKAPMKDWKAACRNSEGWERWERQGRRHCAESQSPQQDDLDLLEKLLGTEV